jgi:hypothetical protein
MKGIFREIGYECVNWIHLSHYGANNGLFFFFLNTSIKGENFLISWATVSCSYLVTTYLLAYFSWEKSTAMLVAHQIINIWIEVSSTVVYIGNWFLDIRWNNLGWKGGHFLHEAMQSNQTLTEIKLTGNCMSDDLMKSIGKHQHYSFGICVCAFNRGKKWLPDLMVH